jgi:hypothetical protein
VAACLEIQVRIVHSCVSAIKINTKLLKELARNFYWLGISLEGGGLAEKNKHEGHRWRQIYGVPFDLFMLSSDSFEEWPGLKGQHTCLKHVLPFKLIIMACFRQLGLGGPIHQYREGCGLSTTIFRAFFFYFLDWLWDIGGGGI